MSEPGKYVLLKKVQPSSKKIKKAKPQKTKQQKKALQKVLPKESIKPIPKHNGKSKAKTFPADNEMSRKNTKGKKKNFPHEAHQAIGKNKKQKPKLESSAEPKNFQEDLSDRLTASRFRFINEQLYTQSGEKAIEVFEQDDSAFKTYHDGYRKQVQKWEINPLDRLIKSIKKL